MHLISVILTWACWLIGHIWRPYYTVSSVLYFSESKINIDQFFESYEKFIEIINQTEPRERNQFPWKISGPSLRFNKSSIKPIVSKFTRLFFNISPFVVVNLFVINCAVQLKIIWLFLQKILRNFPIEIYSIFTVHL